MADADELPTSDQQRLLKELNDSGYPFQHTVADLIDGQQSWSIVGTEFPVSVRGRSTHIDIVAWCHRRTLMVAECKRVNPAYSDWLFARLPVERANTGRGSQFEQVLVSGQDPRITQPVTVSSWLPHHIALEVKTDQKGDAKGQARSLMDALTQTQAAANGMITRLAAEPSLWAQDTKSAMILPVIFTTAQLYTTDAHLGSADLVTGRLPNAAVKRADWVWLEDNVSLNLLHELPGPGSSSLFSVVHDRHARSVAIVTSTAAQAFLSQVANLMNHYF